MMANENSSEWTPNRDAALRALIRTTIQSAGDIAPDQLPHHVRARLKDQIEGSANLEQIIADVLAEEKSKGC